MPFDGYDRLTRAGFLVAGIVPLCEIEPVVPPGRLAPGVNQSTGGNRGGRRPPFYRPMIAAMACPTFSAASSTWRSAIWA